MDLRLGSVDLLSHCSPDVNNVHLKSCCCTIITVVTRFALTSPAQDVGDEFTLIFLVTGMFIAIICRVICVAYVRGVVASH